MQSKALTIRIDPLFWVLAFGLGFYYSGSFPGILIWAVIVLISVLIHELGHALTARFFGQDADITLTFFGGVTKRDGPAIAKWKEFLIILNGPLAGFALALLALFASMIPQITKFPLLQASLNITYVVNVFWTLVNLFPIQPLDGGHLLMILMQGMFGHRGIKLTYFLSGLLALLFGFLFFFFHQVFLGAIFFIFAFDSFRSWKSSMMMTTADHNETLAQAFNSAEKEVASGNVAAAKSQLLSILQNYRERGGIHVMKSTELLAKILYDEGQADEAYVLLSPYRKNLDIEGLKLLQHAAFKSQRNKEALELGTHIHQEAASSETAFINALASAELKNSQATIGWLKTAIDEGLPNAQSLLQNSRFEFIKALPEFQNILK